MSSTQREKLINTAREKLLTAIDEARETWNNKRGGVSRRVSNSATIPPTHQYRISNEDTSLLWGEEKVADINTTLQSWPDRNLVLCCEGLDNRQLTVTVVPKLRPDTAEDKIISFAHEKDDNSEVLSVIGSGTNEKSTLAHEALHERLMRKISSKIGRSPEQTQFNLGYYGTSSINPLRNDPSSPNRYSWVFTAKYPGFPDTRLSRWTLEQIDECNSALEEGHLDITIINPREAERELEQQQQSLAKSLWTPEPRNRTARQKRADETRSILHDTIVSKIGREIQRRTSSNNHINPTRDDPDPPNGYRWTFSENYKSFPDNNEKRLKDWTIDEHDACRAAISNNWLQVESLLDPGPGDRISPRQIFPEEQVTPLAKPRVAIEVTRSETTSTFTMQKPTSAMMPVKPIEKLPAQPPLDEQVETLLAPFKTAIGEALKGHVDSAATMRAELNRKNEEIDSLRTHIVNLEQNIRHIQQGKAADREKLLQAKEDGRIEGQDAAMRYIRETEEARKEADLRTHLKQIARAREEGRLLGLRQASEAAPGEDKEQKASNEEVSNLPTTNGDTHTATTAAVDSNEEQAPPVTTNDASPEALRRSSRPPKQNSFRGFQAINQKPDSNPSITNGNKRAREPDSDHGNQNGGDSGTGEATGTSAEPTETTKVENPGPERDIYGASPPPSKKPKVLNSAKRKELTEQWKKMNDREWPY